MRDRMIVADGFVAHVGPGFDETPGSEDMVALEAIIAAARAKFLAENPEESTDA